MLTRPISCRVWPSRQARRLPWKRAAHHSMERGDCTSLFSSPVLLPRNLGYRGGSKQFFFTAFIVMY